MNQRSFARPNLVSDLVESIDTNLQLRYASVNSDPRTILVLKRSLRLLNGILGEFASIKMPAGIRVMGQVIYFYSLDLVICISSPFVAGTKFTSHGI